MVFCSTKRKNNMTVQALLLMCLFGIMDSARGFGCGSKDAPENEQQFLQCRDGSTTVCVPYQKACALPGTTCRQGPYEPVGPDDELWPFAIFDTYNFDKFTRKTSSGVSPGNKPDMDVSINCRFNSYLVGFRLRIFERELRSWPGEPHQRPYRPFGLVEILPACADFNNSLYNNPGYIVPSGEQGTFANFLGKDLAKDMSSLFVQTPTEKCPGGGAIRGMSVQYFDNEKAWQNVFGIRYFSEGITDILGFCSTGENDTIGGFSAHPDRYQRLLRGSDFWSWSDATGCKEDHLVCSISVTMNSHIGIHRVRYTCCPIDRRNIQPVQRQDEGYFKSTPRTTTATKSVDQQSPPGNRKGHVCICPGEPGFYETVLDLNSQQ